MRELEATIAQMEENQVAQRAEMQQLYEDVGKSLNPIHLLREAIDGVITEPDLQEDFIQTISTSSGFLAKKLIVRKSKSAFLKLIGSMAQYGVTIWVSQKLHEEKS